VPPNIAVLSAASLLADPRVTIFHICFALDRAATYPDAGD